MQALCDMDLHPKAAGFAEVVDFAYLCHMLRLRNFLLAAIVVAGYAECQGQTTREEVYATPEKSGGVYYAYPVSEPVFTEAPEGFAPFYISHYGRHGSRYLIGEEGYTRPLRVFERAAEHGTLTPLGLDVLERLRKMWLEAEGRDGELTPLGARQHRDIARRMFANNAEVFADSAVITACSTQVMRCAHSMFNFVMGLKELNPNLEIPMESSFRNMIFLCHSEPESWAFNDNKREPWREEANKFKAENTRPARLVESLFNDSVYVRRNINPHGLMWDLFWLAADAQNMECDASFYDLFTPEELFGLWQSNNFEFYATNASYPRSQGVNVDNAKNLLRNIVETADEYIAGGLTGATLRFGHDGNITPLSALMQFDGFHGYENDPAEVYKVWSNFKISPMAANMQMIFYKDSSNKVIVKMMMNENEAAIPVATDKFPFYDWDDVRAFFIEVLDTPSKDYMPG